MDRRRSTPCGATFSRKDRRKSTQLFLHEADPIVRPYEQNGQLWMIYIGLIENGFEWANADLSNRSMTPTLCEDNAKRSEILGGQVQLTIPVLGR